MYTCSKCGADCPDAVRSCGHDDNPIYANMSATAVSVSKMSETSLYDKLVACLSVIFRGVHGRV